MISILGRTAILVALAACMVGAVAGLYGGARRSADAARWARAMAWTFFGATLVGVGLMEFALLTHDFSVHYVAEVGSRSSPTWITVVSLWSSLSGSILFWAFILGAYAAAQAWYTRKRYPEHSSYAMGMTLVVGVFFSFLVAGDANPFTPVSPVPLDGPGPNPLLQNHMLMVVHPPMLYLGYVGMTVPFAMGAAALLAGRITPAWSRALRNAMLVPWGFLTLGIILGGWWSYDVLGWGGYWAWDPVENASFLPWLTSTAFLHSAMLMERKDQLKGWTLTLLMGSFLLTILGTFMTRSGVFNSVHSFTQSPIGPIFLTFLALVLTFSVLLLAARIDKLSPPRDGLNGPASRDTAIMAQNLLFAAFTFTVLLGTTWPLINEAISGEKISVGGPYFNKWGVPLSFMLVFLMGVGPALPWGRASLDAVVKRFLVPLGIAVLVVAGCAAMGWTKPWPLAVFGVSAFAAVITLQEMAAPGLARWRKKGGNLATALVQASLRTRRRQAGYVVHLGVVLVAIGVAGSSGWRNVEQLTLRPGETGKAGRYSLTYVEHRTDKDSHRSSELARIHVATDDADLGFLEPRMNTYPRMGSPLPAPAVRSVPGEDLYLSIVKIDTKTGLLSFQAVIQPLVWWIWFGGLVMALGAALAAWPSRRRSTARLAHAKPDTAGVAASVKAST
ncbi:MAG: heme lyase CcmF/NrfE family subunit [Oligoflexia bacterium]|nr:heme lyase CcmF/NrfE family subunit [Oligoflexia bacterium]